MSCSYKIGKLKNFIYLVTNLQYKTSDYKVYLVGGTVYKLGCNLVTFNETESYGGRFKFNTSVVCTINRIIDDTFIKSNKFKLIVENTEGMLFLVSPEFEAKYTSEFRVSNIETVYELTFSTLSNIPTKILETKVISTSDVEKELCRYSAYGITKLSYKNSLDTEWIDIDFLTCEYSKTFNGELNTIQYLISMPVEDNNWYYDLIKFPNNLWDIKLESNGDIVSDTRLFPQYTRQTSEDTALPDIFTITFRGSNSGTLVGNTNLLNYFRWIQTDDYICDGFDKYVKEKKQVFISEWIDTGETRKGLLIERNSPDCGYEPGARYRWVTLSIETDWMCVGTNKYYKLKLQVSYDGETWTDTDKYREGDLYEVNSIVCGYEEIEWKEEEGFICEEYDPSVSWVLLEDHFYCLSIGGGKYYQYEKYLKYINGVPADPPEYKQGELIGIKKYDDIEDCWSAAIYEWRVDDESDYMCDGYSSYYKEWKYKSKDKGQTWTKLNFIRPGALKNQYAKECGWSSLERWISTGVTRCHGDDLKDEYKKQVSYDMGKTWMDTNPPEFKYELAEGGEFYKDCVLKREPLIYEITTLEDNVGIWIELALTSKKYYINWGESDNVAEYKSVWTNYGNNLILLYDSELGRNWWGCPKNYVFEKAGTYQVKVWVGYVTKFGGVFRTERWNTNVNFKGLRYTDKYTYKIKSWGDRPYKSLLGFNFSSTPLTELCDDELGMFKDSPLTSTGSAAPDHYFYSIYHGDSGLADFTVNLQIGAAFTVYGTLLTEIPPNIFKYANNLALATFVGTNIASIPDTLFSNCTGLKDINSAFASTKITSIPEGLFDGCPNISNARSAFANTGITTVPRLWHISSSINTGEMFYGCKSLVSVADDFGQLTGKKSSMFENCTELTSLGGLTLGRGDMSSMLANTKISEFPANVWSNISKGDSAAEMFRDCKEIKAVSGVITGNDIGSVSRMFYNSGLTSVDILFPDLLLGSLVEMFAYCKDLNTVNTNMFNKDVTSLNPTRMFMGCVSLKDWIKDGDTNIWDYPAFYKVDNLPHHLQYTYMYLGCSQIVELIPIEFGGLIGNNITLYPTIITVSPKGGSNESSISFTFTGSLTDQYTSSVLYIDWGDGTGDYNVTSHTYKTSDTYTIKFYTNSYLWDESSDGVGCNYRIENWGACIPNLGHTSAAHCTYWGEDLYGAMRTITDTGQLTDSEYVLEVHPDLFKYAENLNEVSILFQSILVIPPKFFNNCKNLTKIARLVYKNNVLESVDGLFEDYSGSTSMENIITFGTMPRTMNRMFKNSQGLSGDFRMFYLNDWSKLEEAEECFMNSTYTNLEIIKAPSLRKAARMYKGSTVTFDNIQHINSQNIDMTECFADAKMDVDIMFYKEQDDYSVNLTNAFNNCAELTHLPKVTYLSKVYNLWEVEGIIGTGCFKGCTKLLEQYGDIIPDDWK